MTSQSKKKKTNEEGDDRWSNGLPQHVLQMIPARLQISDYQSFLYVCHSWRAAIKDAIATKTCPPAPQLPCLLLRSNDYRRHAFSIDHNHYSLVRDPKIFRYVAAGSSSTAVNCIGSFGGWLIIAAEQCRLKNKKRRKVINNLFFNPITGARVMLPSQSTIIQSSFCNDLSFLKKVVASSDPAAAQKPQDCLVAGVSCDGLLVICRPSDASWSVFNVEKPPIKYRDVEIIDKTVYSLGDHEYGSVYAYTVIDPAVHARDIRVGAWWFDKFPGIKWREWRGFRLVKDDSETKDLFVIWYNISTEQLIQNQREGLLRVFKLVKKKCSWTEVVDLGNMMLFLSETSNKSIRNETFGRNCIYFSFKFLHGFGVYDMANRKIKPLSFSQEEDQPTSFEDSNQTLWFTPHPW